MLVIVVFVSWSDAGIGQGSVYHCLGVLALGVAQSQFGMESNTDATN